MEQVILRQLTNVLIYGGVLSIGIQWLWRQFLDSNVQFQWLSISILIITMGGILSYDGVSRDTRSARTFLTALVFSASTAALFFALAFLNHSQDAFFWWTAPAWPAVLIAGLCFLTVTLVSFRHQTLPLLIGLSIALADTLMFKTQLTFQTVWYLLNSDYLVTLIMAGLLAAVSNEYLSQGLSRSEEPEDSILYWSPLGVIAILFSFAGNVNPALTAAILLVPWIVLLVARGRITRLRVGAVCVLQIIVILITLRGLATIVEGLALGLISMSLLFGLQIVFKGNTSFCELTSHWRARRERWSQNSSIDIVFLLACAIVLLAFLPWSHVQSLEVWLLSTLFVVVVGVACLLSNPAFVLLPLLPFLVFIGSMLELRDYQITAICLMVSAIGIAHAKQCKPELMIAVGSLLVLLFLPEITGMIEGVRFW